MMLMIAQSNYELAGCRYWHSFLCSRDAGHLCASNGVAVAYTDPSNLLNRTKFRLELHL